MRYGFIPSQAQESIWNSFIFKYGFMPKRFSYAKGISIISMLNEESIRLLKKISKNNKIEHNYLGKDLVLVENYCFEARIDLIFILIY